LRLHRLHLALLALSLLAAAPAAAAPAVHGVPLPRGTRAADPSRPDDLLLASGRGFRDTVDHVRRHLRRTGVSHQEIPIYRRRGVTIARFLARQPGLPWTAIHVFQQGGKTFIAVIPAPLDPRPKGG
jgi:hypothetical protein